ncbi:hypothetical protein ACFY9C_00100 [Streptomyces filamentosus]
MQQQVGHAYGSTTALYTWVSDEYRNRLIESVLRRRLAPTTKKEARPSW